MRLFPCAHATHPHWHGAAAMVLAQLKSQLDSMGTDASDHEHALPTLALLYITDHFAHDADSILNFLSDELPLITDWSGTVGIGICVSGVEYFDEPAIAAMLLDIPADQYRVFSGVAPLSMGFEASTALVHADGTTPDVLDLIGEMADRTETGYLFGGLCASRTRNVQFARASDSTLAGHAKAGGAFSGGLSGVAFGPQVKFISRVTQGCIPVAPRHTITMVEQNLALELDGEPAMDVMLRDLHISRSSQRDAIEVVRSTLVGLSFEGDDFAHSRSSSLMRQAGNFGSEVMVRNIVGIDPGRRGVAMSQSLDRGMQLAFCQRNVKAAKVDLTRICAEIREEVESQDSLFMQTQIANAEAAENAMQQQMVGAIYVSCSGRGGNHFGAPNAELQIIRKALGDVPLIGFFAGGEIAHQRLYGYTGVLTVFVGA